MAPALLEKLGEITARSTAPSSDASSDAISDAQLASSEKAAELAREYTARDPQLFAELAAAGIDWHRFTYRG